MSIVSLHEPRFGAAAGVARQGLIGATPRGRDIETIWRLRPFEL
jgi:hypothetical protein